VHAPVRPDAEPEVRRMLDRAAQLARVEHTERVTEAQTRKKLNAHGIGDDEIARQLSTLKWNTAPNASAPITTYSYLHGLQHLDAINDGAAQLSHSANAVLALFRSAEICLHTIGVLSERMLANLREDRISGALANARWRSGFQQLLYKLSLLAVEMNPGGVPGSPLDIRRSAIYGAHDAAGQRLREWLSTSWREDDRDVFGKDIDDPKRYVFFNEFVNTGDERVWSSMLSHVQVPGVFKDAGEEDAAFYARVVRSDEIVRMASAMETEAETDLLPFRVIHQVTEVVASVVNAQVCEAISRLLTARSGQLDPVLRGLVLGNRLLSVADDSIKLMTRTLTPHGYSAVRSNLGMVRGTSSRVLRKTLFNATYPLLVQAFKVRVTGWNIEATTDDDAVHARALEILNGGGEEPALGPILQQLVVLHQHVRTWRDNHIQLPKTHLGISGIDGRPTVSLSGSDSAVDIAHELRKAHTADPIIPLYRALLGTAPPSLHETLTPGGFDEHVAHSTARAVFDVYEDVQERFYRRCPFKPPAAPNAD
jgi:tryptophan 2,3-dioxygenase